MRDMRILVDTNILLDYLLDRKPFLDDAKRIIALCKMKKVRGCIAAHSVVNIFYITRGGYSVAQRKEILYGLCKNLTVIGINSAKIFAALEDESFNDVEDYLQMACAKEYPADYIITRDRKDFAASPIPALEPQAFLALFEQE